MADNSKIEWCDHTFNPWIGCTKVGPGCDHCYAETLSTSRLGVPWGPGQPRRRTATGNWAKPRKWNREAAAFAEQHGRKQRVFCASLADVFDNEVDPAWRADLFALIAATPNLDWLLVTKRIGNVTKMIEAMGMKCLPVNVWLGISVVNQDEANRDVPKLLGTRASVRFLSMEPLLGPVDLTDLTLRVEPGCAPDGLAGLDALTGVHWDAEDTITGIYGSPDPRVDWVIVGGESGADARPMHPDWARSLRDQCAAAGVPFLFKQWGEWFPYGGIDANGCQNSVTKGENPGVWHDWPNAGGFSVRLGKKAAGRYLDGVQHDGYPKGAGGA